MFQGVSEAAFNRFFQCNDDCFDYLFKLKWGNGFSCSRCGHKKRWRGKTPHHVRCKKCRYEESVCAHTVFHKIRIPVLKAFKMAFRISTSKKGISSIELSRTFGINQKSAWLFRRKVQLAMGLNKPGKACADTRAIDGLVIRVSPFPEKGLQCVNVVVDEHPSTSGKGDFYFYASEKEQFTFSACGLLNGKFVGEGADVRLWNLRAWLTGTHHHCSARYLQGYLDEFAFRFRNRKRLSDIFHLLLEQIIAGSSFPYGGFAPKMDNRVFKVRRRRGL